MKRVYEPQDVALLPEGAVIQIDINGEIRLHIHPGGVSFGLINPLDERFAAVISFDKLREILLSRAGKEE